MSKYTYTDDCSNIIRFGRVRAGDGEVLIVVERHDYSGPVTITVALPVERIKDLRRALKKALLTLLEDVPDEDPCRDACCASNTNNDPSWLNDDE